MISLHNVSKTYSNGTKAMKNVSLTIRRGEFVFVVGSSGSGKSTLIKLLLKEEEPDSGRIIVNNKNITKLKRRHIPYLRRDMGTVFQDFRLLPNKTVYENVAFAMQVIETDPREIRRRVPVTLGLTGIAKKFDSYPHELSGGEQQRVALARAIVNDSPILIADEPTGNLDPVTSWEIMKLIQDINQRGTTVVMATHEKEIVDTLRKRVIEIDNGIVTRDSCEGGYDCEA